MCIILFAYETHPEYRFIVAANRDEMYSRPTTPVHFWGDYPHVLAGRDEMQHGTWMGITRSGRFAALTNYRDPHSVKSNTKSRGELVKQYLIGLDEPSGYLEMVRMERHLYNGFNLLLGDLDHLFYYSPQLDEIRLLNPGVYGLSNAQLDTPWPKIKKGKRMLAEILRTNKADIPMKSIFSMLSNVEQPEDNDLPSTGVGLAWERTLSPIFIQSADYGTRSSTLVTVGYDKKVTVIEQTFQSGKAARVAEFTFFLT